MAETIKPSIHPNLEKFISSYDTSKIDYLNLVDDIPEYDVRSDYHQSQSTCTICFYIKNIMPNTFKYTLNKNGLTMRFQFDKNLRRAKIVQKLPEIPSSIKKISLTLTKIEIILNKNDTNGQLPIQYNLPDFEQEVKESIEMEKALKEELDEFDTAPDAIKKSEWEDLPSLQKDKKNLEWMADEYVDSEDSSLAGIDDIEWVDGGDQQELAKPVISQSEGGVVPDYVKENMGKLKWELEKGMVKNQV